MHLKPSLWSAVDFVPSFPVPGHASDTRILEDRGIELLRLYGLRIKPRTGGDLLHGWHGVFSLV
jgi:hypothetical protein